MQPAKPAIEFDYYKTNIGVFFKPKIQKYYHILTNDLTINGITASNIQKVHPRWYKLDGEIKHVTKKLPAQKQLLGWKLDDEQLASEKIPLWLVEPEVYEEYNGELERTEIKGKFASIVGLYSKQYKELPAEEVAVDFTLNLLEEYEILDYSKPEQCSVKAIGESRKVQEFDLSAIVQYEEIEQLITPEFLLHVRPCKLDSKQMFSIIREYLLENINPKQAIVTSNYDFCFAVKKLVKQPQLYKQKPIQKQIECFEMTYAGYGGKPKGYEGYTPIPALQANSLQEMQQKLKLLLDDLLQKVNSELQECSCCNGFGFVEK